MAQWIRHLTTNQGIAGSSPAKIKFFHTNLSYEKLYKIIAPPGGLEPPTFRLTAERASQLRHGGFLESVMFIQKLIYYLLQTYNFPMVIWSANIIQIPKNSGWNGFIHLYIRHLQYKYSKGLIWLLLNKYSYYLFRYGLVVRIAGSHPAGSGSIPGTGIFFPNLHLFFQIMFLPLFKNTCMFPWNKNYF